MAVKEKSENGILETIKTIVYALLIAGVFRTLFFQPFWIPSGSMKETLLIGDFLFVNKMAYGFSYASCPSIPIIGLDAKKLCGFIGGNNKTRTIITAIANRSCHRPSRFAKRNNRRWLLIK